MGLDIDQSWTNSQTRSTMRQPIKLDDCGARDQQPVRRQRVPVTIVRQGPVGYLLQWATREASALGTFAPQIYGQAETTSPLAPPPAAQATQLPDRAESKLQARVVSLVSTMAPIGILDCLFENLKATVQSSPVQCYAMLTIRNLVRERGQSSQVSEPSKVTSPVLYPAPSSSPCPSRRVSGVSTSPTIAQRQAQVYLGQRPRLSGRVRGLKLLNVHSRHLSS